MEVTLPKFGVNNHMLLMCNGCIVHLLCKLFLWRVIAFLLWWFGYECICTIWWWNALYI